VDVLHNVVEVMHLANVHKLRVVQRRGGWPSWLVLSKTRKWMKGGSWPRASSSTRFLMDFTAREPVPPTPTTSIGRTSKRCVDELLDELLIELSFAVGLLNAEVEV